MSEAHRIRDSLRAKLGEIHGSTSFNALFFLAPALLALVLFRFLPALHSLTTSFQHKDAFVGLQNYQFLFTSENVLHSIKLTLIFSLVINPLQILIAFAIALLLVEKIHLSHLWRVLIFMPVAIPISISSMFWGIAFRPDDGIVNAILSTLGIPKQPFLTSPDQALLCIIILCSWVGVGYWTVFLIAGLNEIPIGYYEAAEVDGASWWRKLHAITIPLMRRPLAFVLVADTVANFLLFPPIQILTRGGPQDSTNLFMYEIFREAYTFGDIPLAYSEVVILVLVMLVIVYFQFRLLNSDV